MAKVAEIVPLTERIRAHLSWIFNIMADDDLVMQGERASAGIDLVLLDYPGFSTTRLAKWVGSTDDFVPKGCKASVATQMTKFRFVIDKSFISGYGSNNSRHTLGGQSDLGYCFTHDFSLTMQKLKILWLNF